MKTTELVKHLSENTVITRPGRGDPEKGIDKAIVRSLLRSLSDTLGSGFEATMDAHVKVSSLPKRRGRPSGKSKNGHVQSTS